VKPLLTCHEIPGKMLAWVVMSLPIQTSKVWHRPRPTKQAREKRVNVPLSRYAGFPFIFQDDRELSSSLQLVSCHFGYKGSQVTFSEWQSS
jgi:hypothetical protein